MLIIICCVVNCYECSYPCADAADAVVHVGSAARTGLIATAVRTKLAATFIPVRLSHWKLGSGYIS
jgi:hypothetical protein